MRQYLTLIAASTTLLLTSCASSKVYRYAKFDPSVREIQIPAGSIGLLIELKNLFRKNGFRIVSDLGDVVTNEQNNTTKVTTSQHKTRYWLGVTSSRIDYCITGSPMYVYSLAIVDAQKGEEVLSMSGRDCEHSIIDKLKEELNFH